LQNKSIKPAGGKESVNTSAAVCRKMILAGEGCREQSYNQRASNSHRGIVPCPPQKLYSLSPNKQLSSAL